MQTSRQLFRLLETYVLNRFTDWVLTELIESEYFAGNILYINSSTVFSDFTPHNQQHICETVF